MLLMTIFYDSWCFNNSTGGSLDFFSFGSSKALNGRNIKFLMGLFNTTNTKKFEFLCYSGGRVGCSEGMVGWGGLRLNCTVSLYVHEPPLPTTIFHVFNQKKIA